MADQFICSITLWPVNWVPVDYTSCNGAQLVVNQNAAVYSLIGSTYGGNSVNFNIPNLAGRAPIGIGFVPNTTQSITTGTQIGLASSDITATGRATISTSNLPMHTHQAGFVPTTGPQAVTISQAGSLAVNIPVQASGPGALPPNPLTSAPFLANLSLPVTARGPYSTTGGGNTFNVQGVTVTGTPGVTANPTINVVTGGSVNVQSGGGLPTPLPLPIVAQATVSQLQPSLGLYFIMAMTGIYPPRP